MKRTPIEIVQEFLKNVAVISPDALRRLVAEDAIYVSLNYENPDLKKIMPWAGTSQGPEAFINNFTNVYRFWENQKFEIKEMFGAGESVAVFGSYTYKSNTLDKVVSSPFSILAKIRDEKVIYFQFMEDTFATARSFKVGGSWTIRANPDGGEVEI